MRLSSVEHAVVVVIHLIHDANRMLDG